MSQIGENTEDKAADQSQARARRSALVAVVAAATIFALTVSTTGNGDLTPRISDPDVTTSDAAPSARTTTSVTPGVPVLPGLDSETAASLIALPHPGATVLTEESLTTEIIEAIRSALLDDDGIVAVSAAFTKSGTVYATISYASGETGYLRLEDDGTARLRVGDGLWVDEHIVRKEPSDWLAWIQVTWLGLPREAATARLATPERPDNIAEQTVIGGAAFFEMRKPDWNQIGRLTLLDAEGDFLLVEEIRLDGRGCSSWLAGPANAELPSSELTDGRMALADALYQCLPTAMADLATGAGPYFDLPRDELATALHDADLRTGLFSTMLFALKWPPEEITGQDETIYVFDWTDAQLGHRVELGFSKDGVWQYAVLVEL